MSDKNYFDVSRRVYTLLVILLVGVTAFWGFRIIEILRNTTGSYPREISVEGEGKAYITPDVAKITLGVNTQADTSDQTFLENTKKMNAIMAALEEFKIASEDIKTVGYYLNPRYEWTEDRGSFQNGYTLDQTIEIKMRDFTKVGEVVAAVTKSGANMISGIQFTVEDPSKAKEEARAIAIEKARENAVKIAEQAGFRLGRVLNYYEWQDGIYDYAKGMSYASEGMGGGGEIAPSIEPGQQEVMLKVNLSFRIY
jgi:uncharacterized protein YggE